MSTCAIALLAALFIQGPGKVEIKDTLTGIGIAAQPGDIITVNYTGKLASGKQFDSSVGRAPFQFTLGAGQVIKGWDQGLVGMKVHGIRSLTIPSDLAYGAQSAGEIPPNSDLKFDITMVKIDRIKTKILTEGKGELTALGGDVCELHYELKDDTGKVLDSSYERKQTFQIILGRTALIKGFTAGVIGMKQGEKRELTIPAEFGYGDKGVGEGLIKPGQTLFFTIEMVKLARGETK